MIETIKQHISNITLILFGSLAALLLAALFPAVGLIFLAIAVLAHLVIAYQATKMHRLLDLLAEEREGIRQQAEQSHPPQKRHTLSTVAGLEDALAVATDVLIDLEHDNTPTPDYVAARLQRLQHILQVVRANPNGYDPDTPAGRRSKRVRF